MRVRKLIIGAVVVVLVLGIAAGLALRALLDPQMLAHTIESQAAAWLERPVHIGAARAHVFPTPRITLTTVGVDGPQSLVADEVIVGAGLRALLQRRVEDAVVRVRNGKITLNAAPDKSSRSFHVVPARRLLCRPADPRAAAGAVSQSRRWARSASRTSR